MVCEFSSPSVEKKNVNVNAMFGSISSRDSTSRLDLGTKELAKQEFLECFCSLLCIKEMLYFKSPIKNENANVISTSVSKTVSTEKDVVAELIALGRVISGHSAA